ncbi:arf-GAP with coiled-coil, ANK repeat and PH domain-containing protein 3-like [Protopterus annectens]|uniref:arf-GAP with coiled-coil, ANK repeat and PH domain-containing protein 3-like n=1 Tax=Protopterus annectens TaxID=7888 RepID=UPI001CFB2BEE|nr:arf-GAP with coiled-coil, ANK repeat and PH domain-containing protein 3-like [Protopterus annectens]
MPAALGLLDLQECIKDSPTFRIALQEVEKGIVEVESKLEKLVNLCSAMVETGKAYNAASKLFAGGVQELTLHCGTVDLIKSSLDPFVEGLHEIIQYHNVSYAIFKFLLF